MAYQDRSKVSDIDHMQAEQDAVRSSAKGLLAKVQASGGKLKISAGDCSDATSDLDPSQRLRIKAGLDRAGQLISDEEALNLSRIEAQAAFEALIKNRGTTSEPKPQTIVVDPRLLKALEIANIEACADGDRLSAEQLLTLTAGQRISDRILIKELASQAGILPRQT